jgi:hypothetical protein
VLASNPTLPPKSMAPQHNRTDSAAVKSQEQIRLEVKESMKRVDEADVKTASSPLSSNQLPVEVHPSSRATSKPTSSYWTLKEKEEFLDLIAFYGEDWNAIANHMGSKTPLQVRRPARGNHESLLFGRLLNYHRSKTITSSRTKRLMEAI